MRVGTDTSWFQMAVTAQLSVRRRSVSNGWDTDHVARALEVKSMEGVLSNAILVVLLAATGFRAVIHI